MNIKLRDYQIQSVDACRNAYRTGFKSPLLVLPTGGGKTVVFCYIAEQAYKSGKRVYILVHRQELLRQTSEKLDTFGVRHGCVAPGHSMTGDAVQVASVQTLVRRLDKFPAPDLIIVDEAHHATAGTWKKILSTWPNALKLGTTATAIRMDGKGLGVDCGGFFDTIAIGPNPAQLISMGFLAEPVVFAPPSGIDLSSIKVRAGDYERDELNKRVDKPKITGCAIEHYERICNGIPAICFCVSVNHAEHVAAEFKAAGWAAESLDGKMTDAVRKAKISALANGQLNVLTSCDIISEGTDIPVVGAAILLRPTQSLGLYLQQVGRALRVYPGKDKAYILDHVGNCYRHGMPDDVREWSLDGYDWKKAKENPANDPATRIRQCEKCYGVYRSGAVSCPHCGYIPETGREVVQVDGELKVVTRDMFKPKKKVEYAKPQENEMGRLIGLAKRLGLPGDIGYRTALSRANKRRFTSGN
jgi:superfamily II DNA or RNA helicase